MITKDTLKEDLVSTLKRLESEVNQAKEQYAEKFEFIELYGGLVDRHEACENLGISSARFSQLSSRDQFRTHGCLYSLGDVKAYKKNRRPGRPRRVPR